MRVTGMAQFGAQDPDGQAPGLGAVKPQVLLPGGRPASSA